MEMFDHVGLTLTVLRTLKRMKQAELAARAGIGKSQLSKYEGGKEQPKLAALSKLLTALDVTPLGFFYTHHLILGRAKDVPLAGVPVAEASVLFSRSGEALSRLLEDIMSLHGILAEERLLTRIADLARAALAEGDETRLRGKNPGKVSLGELSADSLT